MNSLHLLQRHGWKREEGRRRCKIVARSRSITFVCGSTRVHTRSIRAGSIDRSPHYRAHCPVQHCLRRQRGGNEGGEGRRRARCISLSSLFHNEAAVSAWVCGRLSSTRKKERKREREGGGKKRNREGEGGGGSFVPWARGYLRALLATSRLLPSFQRWLSTLRKDFLPFTIHLSFYERTGKFVAHQRGTG